MLPGHGLRRKPSSPSQHNLLNINHIYPIREAAARCASGATDTAGRRRVARRNPSDYGCPIPAYLNPISTGMPSCSTSQAGRVPRLSAAFSSSLTDEISRSRRPKPHMSIHKEGIAQNNTSQLAPKTTSRIDSLHDLGEDRMNVDETFLKRSISIIGPCPQNRWMPEVMLTRR
jgi:hypothetical protein